MIEFYGDSFSSDSYGWPGMLAKKLSHDLINHSIAGSSITETIMLLKQHVSFGDIVCITISEPNRLYHPDYFIYKSLKRKKTSCTLKNPLNSRDEEVVAAVVNYYDLLDIKDSREIMYECQVNWLLTLTNKYVNTKFILIPAFAKPNTFIDNYNAVITTPSLIDFWRSIDIVKYEENHFTLNQNKQIADQLYDIIMDYDSKKSTMVNIKII